MWALLYRFLYIIINDPVLMVIVTTGGGVVTALSLMLYRMIRKQNEINSMIALLASNTGEEIKKTNKAIQDLAEKVENCVDELKEDIASLRNDIARHEAEFVGWNIIRRVQTFLDNFPAEERGTLVAFALSSVMKERDAEARYGRRKDDV